MSSTSLRNAAFLVVTLGALSGCAHTATAAAPEGVAPRTVLVTGSRIPRPVDPATGRAVTDSPVSIHSQQELTATGDPSLAGALRRLEPSLH